MNNQEDKYKFFALYLGQKVKFSGFASATIGRLCGVNLGGTAHVQYTLGSSSGIFSDHPKLDNCQLILKPLSQISDEDAIEAAKISFGCDFVNKGIKGINHKVERPGRFLYVWVGESKFEINWESIEEEIITCLNLEGEKVGHNALWVCEFLRSKGYCLPYMGRDPFKEGWAIPAEIHKTGEKNTKIA